VADLSGELRRGDQILAVRQMFSETEFSNFPSSK